VCLQDLYRTPWRKLRLLCGGAAIVVLRSTFLPLSLVACENASMEEGGVADAEDGRAAG
jgi:hypothetical protein